MEEEESRSKEEREWTVHQNRKHTVSCWAHGDGPKVGTDDSYCGLRCGRERNAGGYLHPVCHGGHESIDIGHVLLRSRRLRNPEFRGKDHMHFNRRRIGGQNAVPSMPGHKTTRK
eukprot:1074555-Karenia_brevis.AAC.1